MLPALAELSWVRLCLWPSVNMTNQAYISCPTVRFISCCRHPQFSIVLPLFLSLSSPQPHSCQLKLSQATKFTLHSPEAAAAAAALASASAMAAGASAVGGLLKLRIRRVLNEVAAGIAGICRFWARLSFCGGKNGMRGRGISHKYLSALLCARLSFVRGGRSTLTHRNLYYMDYICEINLLFGPKYLHRAAEKRSQRNQK